MTMEQVRKQVREFIAKDFDERLLSVHPVCVDLFCFFMIQKNLLTQSTKHIRKINATIERKRKLKNKKIVVETELRQANEVHEKIISNLKRIGNAMTVVKKRYLKKVENVVS